MPPVTATVLLYAVPAVAAGSELVLMESLLTVTAATVMLRVAETDCAVGVVESLTVTDTEYAPESVEAGVPVMAPVVLLMASPLGRPVAV